MVIVDKSHKATLTIPCAARLWGRNPGSRGQIGRDGLTGKIYTIAFYGEVHDEAAFEAYAELAAPAVIAAGARYLSRGLPEATYEAGLKARVTLLEWDSLEDALSLYEDPHYLAALEKLGGTVKRDIRIVLGIDPNTFASTVKAVADAPAPHTEGKA